MNERWLALSSAIVGVFLAIVGGVAARGIEGANSVALDPLSPFGTAEYVEWVKSALPVFWLIAIEGLGLGTLAFIAAIGLLLHRKWALRALVAGSCILAVLSVAIMIMAPGSWDLQIVFLLFSALLWWQRWQSRRRNASAF